VGVATVCDAVMTLPRATVIVPAHNESAVISRCLASLAGTGQEIEIVVACNGCTDSTAEIAAQAGVDTVVELTTASKTAAMRAADKVARGSVRVYLDADVVLPGRSLHAMLDRLAQGDVLAVRPPIRYDTQSSCWLVRRYYAARVRIPAVMNSLWGAGVYALSAAGRKRFGEFPDVVGDDLWVDSLFERHEIAIVPTGEVTVRTPRTSRAMLRVLRRTYNGNAQLAGSAAETTESTTADLRRLVASGPGPALDATVYAAFAVAGRLSRVRGESTAWHRDETSRTA
jgi:glycosyltransferase involved in cell wall biosynthesis